MIGLKGLILSALPAGMLFSSAALFAAGPARTAGNAKDLGETQPKSPSLERAVFALG